MKKYWVLAALALVLAGCTARQTMETVDDLYQTPEVSAQQVELALPEEAAAPTMENGREGKIYLCDGYTLTVHTVDAGDINQTLRDATGFDREKIAVMETQVNGVIRYDCAWSAAGEGGDHVGRTAVLDDGSYHYVVTVMAPADGAGELAKTWQKLLSSVSLVSTD